MKAPVIITGTPRSGLWLVAGAFEASGCFGGNLDLTMNHSSQFENIAIRDRLERPLLEGLGFEPRGFGHIPPTDQIEKVVPEIKDQWRSLVDYFFTTQHQPDTVERFIASQVACLLWPLWHAAFPDASWIIVRRRDPDILSSCRATGFVESRRPPTDICRRVRTDEELRLLIDGYKTRFDQMRAAGLKVSEFWPQEIFDGQLGTLQALLQAHDLPWRSEVAEYVRPFQWKHGTLRSEGVEHEIE